MRNSVPQIFADLTNFVNWASTFKLILIVRPEGATAHSPGHRPGKRYYENLRPVRAKALIYSAFAYVIVGLSARINGNDL